MSGITLEENSIEVAKNLTDDTDREDHQQVVEYTPFNPELDHILNPVTFFSDDNRAIIQKGISYRMWVNIFNSSPAYNSEAEGMMGAFVTAAVRAGGWVNIPRITGESVPVFINFSLGEQILIDLGWIEPVLNDEGETVLRPLAPMIEFIEERMERYGPTVETPPSEAPNA